MLLPDAGGRATPPSTAATPSSTKPQQATRTPAASPTQTVISEEVRTNLLQTHEMVVMIQFNTESIAVTAGQIIAGNIKPSEVPQTLLTISGLVDVADWAIPFVFPPTSLQSQWEAALMVHVHSRELMGKWQNGDMDALQVQNEIQGDLTSISQTVDEVEGILAEEYGFDMQSLIEAREEALAGIRGLGETTATP